MDGWGLLLGGAALTLSAGKPSIEKSSDASWARGACRPAGAGAESDSAVNAAGGRRAVHRRRQHLDDRGRAGLRGRQRPGGRRLQVINGGVRNLANGGAHAATNAETQLLVVGTPNVRLLFTVAEGLYRVVAKRSAGIRTPADLRGKRVSVPRDTSAHYYLVRTLVAAGLTEADVTLGGSASRRDGGWRRCRAGRRVGDVGAGGRKGRRGARPGRDGLPGQPDVSRVLQPVRLHRNAGQPQAPSGAGGVRARAAGRNRRGEAEAGAALPLDRQDGQPVRGLGVAKLAAPRVSGRAAGSSCWT